MTYRDEGEDEDFIPEEAARVQYLQASMQAEMLLRPGEAWDVLIEQALGDATDAIDKLVSTKFKSLDEVREVQWEVMRFERLARYINTTLNLGKEAVQDATNDQRERLAEILRGEKEVDDD
jgi:hypothetical protein